MIYSDATRWEGLDLGENQEIFEMSNDKKIAASALSKNMHLRNTSATLKIEEPNDRRVSFASAKRINRKISAASISPLIHSSGEKNELLKVKQESFSNDIRKFSETKFGLEKNYPQNEPIQNQRFSDSILKQRAEDFKQDPVTMETNIPQVPQWILFLALVVWLSIAISLTVVSCIAYIYPFEHVDTGYTCQFLDEN